MTKMDFELCLSLGSFSTQVPPVGLVINPRKWSRDSFRQIHKRPDCHLFRRSDRGAPSPTGGTRYEKCRRNVEYIFRWETSKKKRKARNTKTNGAMTIACSYASLTRSAGPLGPVPRPKTNSSSTCRCSPRPKSEAHLSDCVRPFVACLSTIFIRFQFSSEFHSNSSIHFSPKWNPVDTAVLWMIWPFNFAI